MATRDQLLARLAWDIQWAIDHAGWADHLGWCGDHRGGCLACARRMREGRMPYPPVGDEVFSG